VPEWTETRVNPRRSPRGFSRAVPVVEGTRGSTPGISLARRLEALRLVTTPLARAVLLKRISCARPVRGVAVLM